MRFVLIIVVATVSAAAHAQFGIGMAPGMQCPYPYNPGQGAINGNDEIRNLQGQMYTVKQTMERKKQSLERLNSRLTRAKSGMLKVLNNSAIGAIEEHRRYNRGPGDYQEECAAPDRSASAGGEGADVVHLPGEAGEVEGGGLTPVPTIYCHKGTLNIWGRLVSDGGYMQERVCEYHIPARSSPPADANRAACLDGLCSYYELMDEKIQLETQIAELDGQLNGYERRFEQIQDQIAEGTYCPHCGNQATSQNNGNMMNWIGLGVQVLGALGNAYQQRQQQQQQQQQMAYYARLGYPPPMMPMRPPGMMPQQPMFPGQMAFPGNPYAAPTPGFMGMHNGVYGAMPGAMGPGAFGCQGTNPHGMGNPMGNPFDPFMNSQANPFANPYMQNPYMQNPYMNNGMFNPGFGPGFMPYNGNPMFNPYMQNGMQNPYGNMMGLTNMPPGVLPYMNGMQNPYFQNPYMYNPYAPYGSPYANGMNNGMMPPGMAPYMGAQNPWGNNPYAPGLLPYQGGNPSMANYPGMQGNNPWGAPYIASPVQNFYSQIEALKQQINVIQNGSYYGGGMGGMPPAILPMPTANPVYNTPGGPQNPLPNTPMPMPQPNPTPNTNPQNPVRIR